MTNYNLVKLIQGLNSCFLCLMFAQFIAGHCFKLLVHTFFSTYFSHELLRSSATYTQLVKCKVSQINKKKSILSLSLLECLLVNSSKNEQWTELQVQTCNKSGLVNSRQVKSGQGVVRRSHRQPVESNKSTSSCLVVLAA